MPTDDTRQAGDLDDLDLSAEEMRERIRQGRKTADAFTRRTAEPPPVTRRTRLRLLAVLVLAAAVLLALNLASTTRDLTGHHAPARPPITTTVAPAPSEYIPTPAGPPGR
jgi:ferric-dicitrate binding protein FerR (iron transport regulator)